MKLQAHLNECADAIADAQAVIQGHPALADAEGRIILTSGITGTPPKRREQATLWFNPSARAVLLKEIGGSGWEMSPSNCVRTVNKRMPNGVVIRLELDDAPATPAHPMPEGFSA